MVDGGAIRSAEIASLATCDGDDLAVVGKLHRARLAQERGRVGGEERLAVGKADDHGALQPRADQHVRVISVDHDEREMSFELGVGGTHGVHEVAVVVLFDEVRHRLGVGLRGEDVSGLDEALAQLAVVLDDAVEHDGHLRRVLGREGMRIRLGDASVGGPARVTEARRRRRALVTRQSLQVLEVADGAQVLQPVRFEQRDPGGVIAAVLEALQAVQKQVLALPRPDVSDDPAHVSRLAFPSPPPAARRGTGPAYVLRGDPTAVNPRQAPVERVRRC